MGLHYITMGQQHTHRVGNVTVDCDCVVTVDAANYTEGRDKAFRLFGPVFATSYQDDPPDMKWFPRGIIHISDEHIPATRPDKENEDE